MAQSTSNDGTPGCVKTIRPVGYLHVIPAIAQLVEHLTVDSAEIRWSLARFRVAGFFCHSGRRAIGKWAG